MKDRISWKTINNDYKTIFINKDEFENEIIKSQNQGRYTERAGELLITLVENILISKRFNLDSSKFIITEQLIDYVLMKLLEDGLNKYDPERGGRTAFSLYSRMVITRSIDFMRTRVGKKRNRDIYGERLPQIKEFGTGRYIKGEIISLETLENSYEY